jgi:calcineurin-like phosphoesterase family protein
MKDIWITSDTHFGHKNILSFVRENGKLMRIFHGVEEMDDYIVDRWNVWVKPQDKVYHLGDVAMKKQHIATAGRLNGHKRLVRGNHDIYPTKEYLKYFEEIYASRKIDNLFMTHIPIHPESIRYDWTNVHGHVHNNVERLHFGPRYLNVSTEVTDYRPLHIDEVKQLAKDQYDKEEESS